MENRQSLLLVWICRTIVLFAGHTDVVPPGCGWNTDPFAPTEVDGNLVARGAQDMKTSDVCFAAAAKAIRQNFPNFKGRIALLLTSDEEGDGKDGTAFAIEELKKKGIQPDFCIVGEPTCSKELGDTIKNGRRGSLATAGLLFMGNKVMSPIR